MTADGTPAVDLDAIRARVEAATGEQWVAKKALDAEPEDDIPEGWWIQGPDYVDGLDDSLYFTEADARFVVAAREDIPALLGMVDTLTAALAQYEQAEARQILGDDLADALLDTYPPSPPIEDDPVATRLGLAGTSPTPPDRDELVGRIMGVLGCRDDDESGFDLAGRILDAISTAAGLTTRHEAVEGAAGPATETAAPTPMSLRQLCEWLEIEMPTPPTRDLAALADQWWAESNKLVDSGTRVVTITYAGALRDCARELRAALGVPRSTGHKEDPVRTATPGTDLAAEFAGIVVAQRGHCGHSCCLIGDATEHNHSRPSTQCCVKGLPVGGAPTTEPEPCPNCGDRPGDCQPRCEHYPDTRICIHRHDGDATQVDPDTTGGGA